MYLKVRTAIFTKPSFSSHRAFGPVFCQASPFEYKLIFSGLALPKAPKGKDMVTGCGLPATCPASLPTFLRKHTQVSPVLQGAVGSQALMCRLLFTGPQGGVRAEFTAQEPRGWPGGWGLGEQLLLGHALVILPKELLIIEKLEKQQPPMVSSAVVLGGGPGQGKGLGAGGAAEGERLAT